MTCPCFASEVSDHHQTATHCKMHPRCPDVIVVVVVVAARAAPGGRERPAGVDAAVCVIDCTRQRFDWIANSTFAASPGDGEDERPATQVIERVVDAAIKETHWWRNATAAASERCPESLQPEVRVFLANFSDAVDLSAQLHSSEVLRDLIVLDAAALLLRSTHSDAAEAAIARLLAQPRVLRSLHRRTMDSLFKLCIATIQEVLARNTLVLDHLERFDGTFRFSTHSPRTLNCMR